MGLCVICEKPAEVGIIKCIPCHEKHLMGIRKFKEKNKAAGRCVCGKERVGGFITCATCRETHRIHSQELRVRRGEAGKCTRCGKPLLERAEVTKCVNCMEGVFKFNW